MDTSNQLDNGVMTAISEQPQRPQARQQATPDIHVMRELLDVLATITIEDDPFGVARNAVTHAITTGEIDGLYTPLGSATYNVTVPGLPVYVDPRVTLAQWIDWHRQGIRAPEAMVAAAEAARARYAAFWRERDAQAHERQAAQDESERQRDNPLPARVRRWLGI